MGNAKAASMEHRMLARCILLAITIHCTSASAAEATLEVHGAQDAMAVGGTFAGSVPGARVAYADPDSGPEPVGGGGIDGNDGAIDRCVTSDRGSYTIGQAEAGRYGAGFWHAHSEETGVDTYNPYGTYKGITGALTYEDHPSRTDAVGIFLGGTWMVGEILPRPAGAGKHDARMPVDAGGRAGIRIRFPEFGEIGGVIRDELLKQIGTLGWNVFSMDRGWTDPGEAAANHLDQIEWPGIRLSGSALREFRGGTGISGKQLDVGGSHGRYDAVDISATCLAARGAEAQWNAQMDALGWLGDRASDLGGLAREAAGTAWHTMTSPRLPWLW